MDEIEEIVQKKNKILIYFDQKEFSFPVKILEHVSKGEILIKQLPAELQNCIHLIYFEIGVLLKEIEDVQFHLWDMECLKESFELLCLYDRSVKDRLHLKKSKTAMNRKEVTKETVESKNDYVQVKKGNKKNYKEQKNRTNEKRTLEKSVQRDIAHEIELEDDPVAPVHSKNKKEHVSDVRYQQEPTDNKNDNVLSEFRVFMEKIYKESINTLDAGTIMLAIHDSLEAYSKELALEILHKNLVESFGEEPGESYYQRLMPEFDKIIEYFRK